MRQVTRVSNPLILIVVCLILTACVSTRPLPPEKLSGYERIGILSAMGDDLEKCDVQIFLILSRFERMTVDFGADEIITRGLEQALSPKYEVIDLSDYRQAFLKSPTPYPGEIPLPSAKEPFIPSTLQKLMGDRAPQAYVVITPSQAGMRDTDMAAEGIGVVKIKKVRGYEIEQFYAAYRIRVIDGVEAKVVADMKALPIGRKPPTSSAFERFIKGDPEPESVINAPSTPIARKVWEQPGKQTERLKKSLEEIMARSLPETLRHVGLID